MRRRAFTLIELLVVIAIIAILAAILFPVFAQTREKARQAQCQSNLQQIGKGLAMYSQDFDEKLCPVRIWATGGVNPVYPLWRTGVWDNLIQPYVKNTGIFVCPSWDVTQPALPDRALTYGMNYRLAQFSPTVLNDASTLWYDSVSISSIRRPAETIFIVDNVLVLSPRAQVVHRDNPSLWPLQLKSWNPSGYTRFPQDPPDQGYLDCCWYGDPWRPGPVHQSNTSTNVLYLDGHVKLHRTEQLVNPLRGSLECLYDNGP